MNWQIEGPVLSALSISPLRSALMSPRFHLRDLLVGAALTLLVVCLMVFGMRRARENISRAACENNLRQIGAVFQTYHNSVGYYPNESPCKQNGSSGSFYYDTACFIQICDRDAAAASREEQAIREYLCPARRGREVGPKADYGYGAVSEFGDSVLGAARPITRGMVNRADGDAFTLMLSHKGVRPSQYDGSGPNDYDYYVKTTPNSRDPLSLHRDSDSLDMWQLIGSPHADGAPSLFVDGHVAVLPYVGSDVLVNGVPLMAARWAYNDGNR
ncbi:MAG: DUF1559 domain-containing protein [Planctomycetia bacterium]|nr:DUF1559 domain-containing protein [Planctomycetia bacterium]